ncbi:MAG: hypothetical protein KKG78_06060 [Alphaproteobacteria bacterium]|nr:hypothetical protein [Alphaproteobacteria bacterium]
MATDIENSQGNEPSYPDGVELTTAEAPGRNDDHAASIDAAVIAMPAHLQPGNVIPLAGRAGRPNRDDKIDESVMPSKIDQHPAHVQVMIARAAAGIVTKYIDALPTLTSEHQLTEIGRKLGYCGSFGPEIAKTVIHKYGGDPLQTKIRLFGGFDPDPEMEDLVRRVAQEAVLQSPEYVLADMNRKYRQLTNAGGKVRIVHLEKAADGTIRSDQGKRDFADAGSNRSVCLGLDEKGRLVMRNAHVWWMSHPDSNTYVSDIFFPGQVELYGSGDYNIWRGWPERLVKAPAVYGERPDKHPKDHWPTLFDYLFNVICSGNSENFAYVMQWLAHVLQHPRAFDLTAIVLKGGMGIGKTKFMQLCRALVGPDYAKILTRSDEFTGKFNVGMANKLFIGVDEAVAANDKVQEGLIKNYITGQTYSVERKFVDAVDALKYFRLVMGSNERWVAPVGLDDRRFFVLKVSEIRKKDAAYFAAVDAAIDGPELAAMFEFLRKLDISNFRLGDIPETEARIEQKAYSLRGPERILVDVLDAGMIRGLIGDPTTVDGGEFSPLLAGQPISMRYCMTTPFFEMLEQHRHGSNRITITMAGTLLKALSLPHLSQRSVSATGTAKGHAVPAGRFIPDLGDARRIFEAVHVNGAKWNWQDDSENWSGS